MEKYEIQKLRDLPIEKVAKKMGIKVEHHKALCPFHDDHHASLSFNTRKNNCRCYVCMGDSVGTIDLVMKYLGKDFLSACRWLAEEHQVQLVEDRKREASSSSSSPGDSSSGGSSPEDNSGGSSSEKSSFFDASRYARFFEHPWLNLAARRFLFEERRIDERVAAWCRLTSWTDKKGVNWLQIPYFSTEGIKTFEDEVSYFATHEENGPKFNPFFIPKMIADIASGQISIHFGFHGPNYTTTSACASSSNALADAFNLIRLGKANIIVSGGAEAAICACGVGGFNAMHALSTRNDDPEHASRPFSASRDGFIMGEGAGCLILEELEHAKARGAKIYAEMVGEGESADAYHITASHPEGLGAKLVMERALADANLKPEDIDYINVHGTSTHVGDISEAKAIKAVFGDAAYKLNISSTKSMTGHLLGAAGAVEAMACVLSVKNDIVPPTINHEEGDNDPELDYNLNFTFNKAQKREVRAALSNTFGFGGHNCCVVFKKYAE